MNKNQELQISKTMCHALRHYPEKYNLKLDTEGYVDIELLILGIKKHLPKYKHITLKDIAFIVENDEKGRYEIKNDCIRATYGHSIKNKIIKTPVKPPDILYHGTTKENASKILKTGLKSMGRQYVHLSKDIETAMVVGKRRTITPVLLVISAKEAFENGCDFYEEPNDIWLSDCIEPQYITIK